MPPYKVFMEVQDTPIAYSNKYCPPKAESVCYKNPKIKISNS